MDHWIIKIGRTKLVILITGVSILISLVVMSGVVVLFQRNGVYLNLAASYSMTIIIPLLVTPGIAWVFWGMFFKIHELETEMRRLATTDMLTGVLSRRAFFEMAEQYLKIAKRKEQPVSLCMVDIDHFKKINDQYGHEAGDKVLTSFGEIIISTMRKSDLAGRIGGEEFAFLLLDVTQDEALQVLDRLQAEIAESSIIYQGETIRYTASIGVVTCPTGCRESLDALLRLADQGLYEAKANGRNQVRTKKIPHPN